MPSSDHTESKPGGSPARAVAFRLAAVLLGLLPFVIVETAFTALDWGRPTYRDDPFVGFEAVHPLFVPNADGTQYGVAPSRLKFFRPESFDAEKAEDEFRIFCLGGSTVQGRPFAIETAFTTWLELSLEAADPERRWDVLNCGGVSYASYRLVPILEEVLGHQPDLIVLYTGQNEFLEDRTYAHIKHLPTVISGPAKSLLDTRTYVLLRGAYVRVRGRTEDPSDERPILADDTDAILEYQGGLEKYHRDDVWRKNIIDHYRFNIERMVQMCREANLPLVLVNPVCNLRDCAPFKNQHRDGLTDEELSRWEWLVDQAAEVQSTNMSRAIELLLEAESIDAQHAGLQYLLAKCHDALGRMETAYRYYVRAKELDVCPLRIVEPMNEALLDIARRTDTPLVDVRKMYEKASEGGIPGGMLLIDHVHPSIPGHQLIADGLLRELIRQGVVQPVSGWEETQERSFRDHLESLDDLYFAIGQERLEALRCWTQGKSNRNGPQPEG